MNEASKKAFTAMRIFFTGVGGQGTLLATRLVGEAALEEGLPVTMSEIHGMAQRGGVVESSVVVGDAYSPIISDGWADILMAFEPIEAARAIPKCHRESLVISNTTPIIPFTVATGQGACPDIESLYLLIEEKVKRLARIDADSIAKEAGSDRAVNIVIVGVLAGSGELPISMEKWQDALKKVIPAKILEVNCRAFEMGVELGRRLTQ
ncbi:MAG: indolepyruvate oxidoreductase subunit beta [Syntrophobacteraceae bacterium]